MKITIKNMNNAERTFSIDAEHSDTIHAVRYKIYGITKIPPNHQGLIFHEKYLEDDDRELWEYNIQNTSILLFFSLLCVPVGMLSSLVRKNSNNIVDQLQQLLLQQEQQKRHQEQQHQRQQQNKYLSTKQLVQSTAKSNHIRDETRDEDDNDPVDASKSTHTTSSSISSESSCGSSITTTPSIGRTVVVDWDDDFENDDWGLDDDDDWEADVEPQRQQKEKDEQCNSNDDDASSSTCSSLTASIKVIHTQHTLLEDILDKELENIKSMDHNHEKLATTNKYKYESTVCAVKNYHSMYDDCEEEEDDITECEKKNELLSSGVWF